ncbi:Rnase Y domain-containing protein, partial [Staphylococcus epidermidis]|uniref:Rnase Y domain-containing protein n=1 Tax=Staphylococcus epidermidis TaxID=1282 RepID=UPI0037D9C122
MLKEQPGNQLPQRRGQLQTQQTPLLQKQQNFHPKSHLLHKEHHIFQQKQSKLQQTQQQLHPKHTTLQTLIINHQQQLQPISPLTQQQPLKQHLQTLQQQLSQHIPILLKQKQKQAEQKV